MHLSKIESLTKNQFQEKSQALNYKFSGKLKKEMDG